MFGTKYKSVFISVADDLELNGVYFGRAISVCCDVWCATTNPRRAAPEFTFSSGAQRRPLNEDRCILPYADTTDIQIDSLMPYEPLLLK